jgi:hypothetical protein
MTLQEKISRDHYFKSPWCVEHPGEIKADVRYAFDVMTTTIFYIIKIPIYVVPGLTPIFLAVAIHQNRNIRFF